MIVSRRRSLTLAQQYINLKGNLVKGAIKETAGKVVGDAKLAAEGKSGNVEGKIQNAIGGAAEEVVPRGARAGIDFRPGRFR